ncbi:hypothetical protein JB92DRAFT_2849317 [Gautieria morchelliformis]|nr:hypothetical protein JB92DRAFT_2849317 [Gautieria morchelliformis]
MDVTRVPPEVWLHIFRDASYVTLCDMGSYDPLAANGPHMIHSGKLLASIREALSTKCSVSLVCKLWSAILVDCLYDFIIVRDAAHIPLLVYQLSRLGTRISSKVQRIDFMCVATTRDIYYNGASYNARQLAHAAAKLIRLCSRLRALSSPATLWERVLVTSSKRYTRLLVKALIQVKDTLECLEWRSHWSFWSAVDLYRVIPPHLRVLLFPSDTSYSSSSPVEDSHWDDISKENALDSDEEVLMEHAFIDRPAPMNTHLHTADAEYCWRWSLNDDRNLSSLRHVIISPHSFSQHSKQFGALFQVNTITFHQHGFQFFYNAGLILPSTVHTIIIHAQDFPVTPPRFLYIERIGLMGADKLTSQEYDYVFNFFVGESGPGEDSFPTLNMIRFMDTSLHGILAKRGLQFKLWERRCRSKGVRLEDQTGQLITPNRL